MAANAESSDAPRPIRGPAPNGDADLKARVARLESQISDLLERLSHDEAPAVPPRRSSAAPAPEQRPEPQREQPAALPDTFWALNSLKARLPRPGGVVYAGAVDVGSGHVEYQWGRPTEVLLHADWPDRAERIAALGHPLRLLILRRLLDGERTVAQLVDELDLASTGVTYHHLNQLQSAGWVSSPQRGIWTVPPTKIVPLLAIIIALEDT